MCRVLKVLVVAPSDRHLELRRALSSVNYEIVATVAPTDPVEVAADVAVLWEPGPETLRAFRDQGLKVVAVGGEADDADLVLPPEELGTFRDRVWELFRAR